MENILTLSLILDSDSYKFSQWVQYPSNTTSIYSYFESRGGLYEKTMFFGLQYIIKKYLSKPITKEQVEEANEFAKLHGVPFNYAGWMAIVVEHAGYLPLLIKSIPEGVIVPVKNVLMTVTNTDEKFYWLVSWFETMLVRLWYPMTVATHSWHMKQDILYYLKKSSDKPEEEIAFKLHDFGSRGVTCQEQAMIGGASHLVNFMGSDTIAGVWMANKYYNEKMSGFSIPASEHSTITTWGKDNEVYAFRNMIEKFGGGPVFACVSDSYDIYNACEKLWGEALHQEVIDMPATLVVRPDSGNPIEVVMNCLYLLDGKFGCTTNTKGYKVLNKVRVIQGDGISSDDVSAILNAVLKSRFSATNVSFGMGGGLLQKDLNRDTQKFAFKCSSAVINNKRIHVFKDPITDIVKRSKKGLLDLVVLGEEENGIPLVRTVPLEDHYSDSIMRTVFENGELLKEYSFAEVRNNSNTVYGQHKGWINRDVY